MILAVLLTQQSIDETESEEGGGDMTGWYYNWGWGEKEFLASQCSVHSNNSACNRYIMVINISNS